MKLRNLLFGTMIACAFVACSNDDDPTPNPTPDGGDGKTYVEVNAKSIETKANTDATISSLTLIVADNDGEIEAIASDASKDKGKGDLSRKVVVTPGRKKVVMLANVTVDAGFVGKSLTELAAKTNSIASETDGNLSMNSVVYDIDVVANVTNYLGYDKANDGNNYIDKAPTDGVKLYRNVAKVVLSKISVADVLGEDNTHYPNAALDVKQVYIANAKDKTSILPSDFTEWGETQVSTGFSWLAGVATTAESGEDVNFLVEKVEKATTDYVASFSDKVINANGSSNFNKSFYVYENNSEDNAKTDAKTLLVIKGDFSYETGEKDDSGVQKRTTMHDRYYTIAIGRTGFKNGFSLPTGFGALRGGADGINGATAGQAFDVLRNLQYNISLTVKGIGYKTPGGKGDSQMLDVQVQVVPFGYVNQDVTIE